MKHRLKVSVVSLVSEEHRLPLNSADLIFKYEIYYVALPIKREWLLICMEWYKSLTIQVVLDLMKVESNSYKYLFSYFLPFICRIYSILIDFSFSMGY